MEQVEFENLVMASQSFKLLDKALQNKIIHSKGKDREDYEKQYSAEQAVMEDLVAKFVSKNNQITNETQKGMLKTEEKIESSKDQDDLNKIISQL